MDRKIVRRMSKYIHIYTDIYIKQICICIYTCIYMYIYIKLIYESDMYMYIYITLIKSMEQIFAFFWTDNFHDRQFSQTQSQLLYCIQVRFVIIVGYDLNSNENQKYTLFSILIYGVWHCLFQLWTCKRPNLSRDEHICCRTGAHMLTGSRFYSQWFWDQPLRHWFWVQSG